VQETYAETHIARLRIVGIPLKQFAYFPPYARWRHRNSNRFLLEIAAIDADCKGVRAMCASRVAPAALCHQQTSPPQARIGFTPR
jgi:hypothetical protein